MPDETGPEKQLRAVLFYGMVALLAFLVFRIFETFLVPLAWAVVLVVVAQPWHVRLERRWGRTRAAAASTAAVTLILILPVLFLMAAFVRQGFGAARAAEAAFQTGRLDWINAAWQWVQLRVPGENLPDLATMARQVGEKLARFLGSELGAMVRNVARFLFHLVVTILAMFYLFRDSDGILDWVRQALPFEEGHRERMIGETRDLIFASVTSTLAAAAVHGVVGGTAFAIVGIGAAIFWGVMMAFLSLVPLVGSSIIWLPAAISLMVQGKWGRGIALLVICAGMAGLVDNVMRPWMISGRARLSGLIVFISVLGGIGVFGMLGVVMGPIVVAAAASVLDLYALRSREPSGHAHRKESKRKPGPVLE
ncbi:MAG TPA: AI-2E family transporter [Candidatus Acidoferrales bacterium]|nr:AI-2E family transporter [Candidatus Acidoferrales bacterium]